MKDKLSNIENNKYFIITWINHQVEQEIYGSHPPVADMFPIFQDLSLFHVDPWYLLSDLQDDLKVVS